MYKWVRAQVSIGLLALGLSVTAIFPLCNQVVAQPTPPPTPREFRGVWVTTAWGLDWPSDAGLNNDQQKAELVKILDAAQQANLNAIIFQVRSMGDATYPTELAPWSSVIMGKSGVGPSPAYDPLEFAIRESHARGMEFHAWLNPFRVGTPNATFPPSHISNRQPGIVRKYGKHLWLDPTDERSHRHLLDVIRELMTRYDLDGIHFDDYFYPYPEKGVPFDDNANWQKYLQSGGKLTRSDWRRDRVNDFVSAVNKEIKAIKPHVRFGISPFGIWQPGYPEGITGLNAHEELYADARKWFQDGLVDYLAPQLYWEIGKKGQEFPKLLDWWISQNTRKRHLWIGLNTIKFVNGKDDELRMSELMNQIQLTQQRKGSTGQIHFRAQTFDRNTERIIQELKAKNYRVPALPPATTWLDATAPGVPTGSLGSLRSDGGRMLSWKSAPGEKPLRFVLTSRRGGQWFVNVYGNNKSSLLLPADVLSSLEYLGLSAVDSAGNESVRTVITIP
jgi:uncharacterized lipoprotein YddW (UPF0748 family)